MLAACFAAGIALGLRQDGPGVWPWCAVGVASGIGAAALRRLGPRAVIVGLAAATLCLGAAWSIVRSAYVATDDLAAWIDDEPTLLRMSGTALGSPRASSRGGGSMAAFDHRPEATVFRMHIDRLEGRAGATVDVDARVYVCVGGTIDDIGAGTRLAVAGFLRRPSAPANPGAFDSRAHARLHGYAGIVTVPGPDLVTVSPHRARGLRWALCAARERLRAAARNRLNRDLPASAPAAALLGALLLGDRDAAAMHELSLRFRHVGLAHLLAISGLHLAVCVGAVLLVVRVRGDRRRWHAALVIVVVCLYLLIVEVRMPVLRAGLMLVFGAAGQLSGRRLRTGGLVALSAIALLAWRPGEITDAGFQLSFGVVLGIVHLAPVVRRRWFGPPDLLAPSVRRMLGEWLRTSVAVAFTAWAVATPIVIHHFGIVSPLAVGLSVVALPALAVLLVMGYLKIALTGFAPRLAEFMGAVLAWGADRTINAVTLIDGLPGSHLHVPFAPASWSIAVLLWVVVALAVVPRRRVLRRLRDVGGVALAGWLVWPTLPLRAPVLTIDMLSVGDGSCFVLRSGRSTVIFDAGSSRDFDVGHRLVVPALARLGVRSIDAVIISHANIDHYSAALEIIDSFRVGTVLVTPHLHEHGVAEPEGATAFLLRQLEARGARADVIGVGAQRRFGGARWTWLHPPPAEAFAQVNDSSMVIRIDAGGRRVLLTGDIEAGAIARLLGAEEDLEADVLELPHHGSFNDAAVALVERADPAIVMQSTGWRRWKNDRWRGALTGRERLVTARDGACTVTIDRGGCMRTRRFLEKLETRRPAEARGE